MKNGLLHEHMTTSLPQWWWCHHMHSWLLSCLHSQWCTSHGCQTRPLYTAIVWHSTDNGPRVWMQWLGHTHSIMKIEPPASVVSVVAMFCLLGGFDH